MARAGFHQPEVFLANILSLIRGRQANSIYKPKAEVGGAIKLMLGRGWIVLYTQYSERNDIFIPEKVEVGILELNELGKCTVLHGKIQRVKTLPTRKYRSNS